MSTSTLNERPKNYWRVIAWAIAALIVFVLVYYLFWVRPNQELNQYQTRLSAKEFLELKNGIRGGLAQAIGGAGLLMGLVFTWRSIRATERNVELAQESARNTQATSAKNLEITQEGQITDRFTKAIEQLGKAETRYGGIYALERIANDYPELHWSIVEILTAFVRRNSSWDKILGPTPHSLKPYSDTQAVLTVLGRRDTRHENPQTETLSLHGTNLKLANLAGARLQAAKIKKSYLEHAVLSGAHLERASFENSELTHSKLDGAYLAGTDFTNANLEGADLQGAHDLTIKQIIVARGWEKAILPEYLQTALEAGRKGQ